ncbi:MAG: SgcJ/EcaC family oxidoreductase [Bryobacteraceae bacterium]
MKSIRFVTLLWLLFVSPAFTASSAESSIRAVLNTQVDAWNKGDLSTFVTTYADDCLFVGKQVVRGRPAVLARYQKSYSNAAAMGKLEFTDLEVHEVDPQVALVIGHFHLARTVEGGGDAQGVFSLVFHRIDGAWQIVLDHTS